jgi:hypothetical protein
MTEKYSPELVEKYLKEMKKIYPETDLHLLEMAILQYLLLDCDENYKPDKNNEEYLKAKKLYEQKEFRTVLLNEEIKVKD